MLKPHVLQPTPSGPKKIDWANDDDDWGDMIIQPELKASDAAASNRADAAPTATTQEVKMNGTSNGAVATKSRDNTIEKAQGGHQRERSNGQRPPKQHQHQQQHQQQHSQQQHQQHSPQQQLQQAATKGAPEVDEDGFTVASSKRSKILQQQQQQQANRGSARGGRGGGGGGSGGKTGRGAFQDGGFKGQGTRGGGAQGRGAFGDNRGRGKWSAVRN
jgi:hypothetical protein